ncbi:MAG: aminopeptidase P N-terminal domain-containing protein [Bacteroidetes bacterium]|nr:aminopeptidase P N-terminal domain-containing protein [Bacteroidota bacterium]MDA0937650.1 aminopeptidase P N-terminal domain-containing protein [Bacteroidota bacterium]MDA1344384.1 aminopeptidase P N-terminal domain-containing protein [Bacteroidota bacterium]
MKFTIHLLLAIMVIGSSNILLAQERFDSGLSPEFHKSRRNALREKMPENSVAVLFNAPIRNRANDTDYEYHPDPNFYYLTGWKEPHAVLLIYKEVQNDANGTYDEVLYVRQRNAYDEMWNGKRAGLEGAQKSGFERVVSRNAFASDAHQFDRFETVLIFDFDTDIKDFKNDPNDLFDLQASFKEKINYPKNFNATQYHLYQKIRQSTPENAEQLKREITFFTQRDEALAGDPLIAAFLTAMEPDTYTELRQKSAFSLRTTNFDISLLGDLMADLREIKTPEEVALIRKAVAISSQGQIEVMKAMHPTMSEREIQGIHQYIYKRYGAAHEGYPSIVGAGANGCVLHYISNDLKEVKNQLVLMDLGAEYKGYTADVTRTVPAKGRFTDPQKALYKIVYDAQEAGIAAAQIGASFADIATACRNVVAKGLVDLGLIQNEKDVRKYLPHGVAHHIGLDVHDPGNYALLEENMIITVEPGIYVPEGSDCDPKWWNIGIRIEDDILISKKGPINLSAAAPRAWEQIEALMQETSPLDQFQLPEIN